MGDAKVKQPYFGTPPHQQATTSKAGLSVSSTTMIDVQKSNPSQLKPSGKDDAASKSPTKYELLKARKAELDKRLNEKYAQLQQIKREEAQLIGMYPSDFSSGVGSQDQNGAAPTLRRKIGTSFKLPENLLNNKEDDINKLLLEKQIQQQISEASLRLANDTSQAKSVRRTHKQNYESAQQKLLAMNQNLSLLKKRQQQQQAEQQKPPPATRDDIDIHKNSNANRFRSNSNSSSMMMMNMSERRNSIKSNTSSNHSSNLNTSGGPLQKQQQQQLLVQIPAPHSGHYHSQQISPYSIHSGTLSVMPSGSQSMTPAASAAMVSQLSMLRHRARCDSFSGIMTYDLSGAAVDPAKMSPVSSNSSHHHHSHPHQHYQPQQQSQPQGGANRLNKLIQQQIHSYSPPPGHHPHGNSPGYVLSPPASASSNTVGQAFVYDTKMISRFQAPPPPPAPLSTSQNVQSDSCYGSSIPPNSSTYDSQHEITSGLGGYWMMLETGEKVWCSVDSRFSSLDRKQGGGSMKLSRSKLSQYPHAAPTKSNSMGNFDFINKQQQQLEDSIQPDTISVTSASSENKKREKVWRETSLDSPVVKHRTVPSPSSSMMMMMPPPLPAYPQPPPPPPPTQHHVQQQAHLQTPLHVNTSSNYGVSPASPLLLSPQQMRYYQQRQQQLLEQQRQRIKQLEEQKQQAYQQHQAHQRLLQQKQLRSPPQLPKHQHSYSQQPQPVSQQQHLDLLPQSPQFYDHENHNLPPHYYQSQEQHHSQNNLSARHPDLLISPTLSASSSNTLTSPTFRPQSSVSPTPSTITTTSTGAAAIIHATPDIQTESPKNVTIVQQGKIMPYKEVTKPFEMSDFYKYSTKFRQKQQQQQQQHQFQPPQQQSSPSGQMSPNGNSMLGPNGELMQKAVYQPPNPSMCRPINYN